MPRAVELSMSSRVPRAAQSAMLCFASLACSTLLPACGCAAGSAGSAGSREKQETAGSATSGDGPSFVTASVCAECHSNSSSADAMRDPNGDTVGFFDLWQSSMMANAARDPLWRAVVSAESALFSDSEDVIENTCMRCHAPMAASGSGTASLDTRADAADLGRDGVACAVCHQITPEGLGTESSFSGNFVLNEEAQIYGPHQDPFAMPMERFSGFTPTQADHVESSALCATCHTLRTHSLSVEGSQTGKQLPEQTPYLEWKNSQYNDESGSPAGRSCQNCHMPTQTDDGIPITTALARRPNGTDFPPLTQRSPYARHIFVGGNTLIPAILRDNADELGVTAPPQAFDETIRLATSQLQNDTASLSLTTTFTAEGTLTLDVSIANLTGHKFPTGHPARRAWLHVVVTVGNERVHFESGAVDSAGRLVDQRLQLLPSELPGGPVQPHRTHIAGDRDVYILESVMLDDGAKPTYSLLRGSAYGKDNRLLPAGFSYDHPDAAWTLPVGVAQDADFLPGGDIVRFEVDVSGVAPRRAMAELMYQPLSARYAAELFENDTPEVERFRRMYEAADRTPVVVARAEASLAGD